MTSFAARVRPALPVESGIMESDVVAFEDADRVE
jgi:hypothetical protein